MMVRVEGQTIRHHYYDIKHDIMQIKVTKTRHMTLIFVFCWLKLSQGLSHAGAAYIEYGRHFIKSSSIKYKVFWVLIMIMIVVPGESKASPWISQ